MKIKKYSLDSKNRALPDSLTSAQAKKKIKLSTVANETQKQIITFAGDQNLRKDISAIQKAREKLMLNSRAAMPFEPLSLTTETIAITITWLAAAFGHDAAEFMDKNVIAPMGEYYNDNLTSNLKPVREKAIEDLKNAKIENLQKLVKSVEFILRLSLVKSLEYGTDKLSEAKHTVRELISILQGLYEADDSSYSDKVHLDEKMKHGWQDGSIGWSNFRRGAEAVSLITNVFRWGTGWSKKMSRAIDEADLTQERGWFKHDNASNLIAILLENCHRGMFPVIDEATREHLRSILILNWKVPIVISKKRVDLIQGSKIPSDRRSKNYRLGMYETMLAAVKKDDPLFLKIPLSEVPSHYQEKAKELREGLLEAFAEEVALQQADSTRYSELVVTLIKSILEESTGIEKWKWNEDARKLKENEERNELVFKTFKTWGNVVNKSGEQGIYKEAELREVFQRLNQSQKDNISLLRTILTTNKFNSPTELNKKLETVLKLLDLSNEQEGERLTYLNKPKGLYFFRFLNQLLEQEVTIDKNSPVEFKTLLDENNKENLLRACKKIVHDDINFSDVTRNLLFFTEPDLSTVPGQALTLHHRLTRCFNEDGYADIYGLKVPVLTNIVDNLKKDKDRVNGGFLLSGPPGTGKSFFAEAIANQIAAPRIILNRETVKFENEELKVCLPGLKDMTLGVFFKMLNDAAPCVLLLDDVENFLIPRRNDPGCIKIPTKQEEYLTGEFLTKIQEVRDGRGASKVIIIMTTNSPPTKDVDLSTIDEDGRSPEAKQELDKYVSYGTSRERRIDHIIFSFHGLYDSSQGELLAKHFLDPYIKNGKVKKPGNYSEASEAMKEYTPSTIERIITGVIKKAKTQVTVDEILTKLKKEPARSKIREDSMLANKLRSKITSLVEVDQIKSLKGKLDYSPLVATAQGLTPAQIKKALEDLTPEVLTQENILEAFRKVKKQKH